MKRTPLKRGKPLARRTRLAPKRATPRRSSRVEDRSYMGAVHGLPCCAEDLSPCAGHIEADHAGKKSGMGRKADDSTCIPLCHLHHEQRHGFVGPFRAWTAPRMRAWLDLQIADTRAAIAASASLASTSTNTPGSSELARLPAPAGGQLSRALELLPEPGAIAVGSPVQLGTREGAVEAVLPDRIRVRWLDGSTTTEALTGAAIAAR